MTAPLRTCEEHGPFATRSEDCPVCGETGALLLETDRRRRLSTFLSGALRHFPDDVDLELDDRGWAEYGDLLVAVERTYDWADEEAVDAVIAADPNGRFERTDDEARRRVRASYGHSVDVDLEPTDAPVPDELYHGTAPETLPSIREDGLRPMSRQQVHLSGSLEAARRVGQRHTSDPVVLVVDAGSMLVDGRRIAKRGRETYTTDRVPPKYLSRPDG
ncbi:RNA 2'-phosphotransferase [Halobiforma nitratireducens]|uniref:RNA 2'-phosphotransferase n=1 Tax=Halobiforma nitratireducens TaxID=130048 RepID=UPI0006776C7F|nr:RNA 2'-phosphotransferase [Halobiforma nitratireducens]